MVALKHKPSKEQGSALILTLSVLVILSFLGVAALNSTDSETDLVYERLDRLTAFSLAESGLEHGKQYLKDNITDLDDKLDDLEDDPIEGEQPGKNPGKSYTLELDRSSDCDTSFCLISTGTVTWDSRPNQEVRLRLEVERGGSSVDMDLEAAINFFVPDPELELGNNGFYISGYEYDLPGHFDCAGGNCTTDWKVDDDTSLPAVFSTEDIDSGDDLEGGLEFKETDSLEDGIKVSDEIDEDSSHWLDLMDDLEKSVPESNIITDTSDVGGNANLGTRDNPEVHVVKKDKDDKKPPKITGQIDGAGILILKDGARFAGTFHFEGLVLVDMRDEDSTEFFSSGTADLYGGAVIASNEENEADDQKASFDGDTRFVYSNKALEYADQAGAVAFPKLRIESWERL